jgi:hypothetical protein
MMPTKRFVSGIDAVRADRKRRHDSTSDWHSVLVHMVQMTQTAIKRKGCDLWYSVNANVFRATVNALLIQVVGPNIFERYSHEIMQYMSSEFANPATIVIMSRQVGKTDATVLACAVALLACQQTRDIICGCYANTPLVIIRNVGKIVDSIEYVLANHPGIVQPIFRAKGREYVAFERNGHLREIIARACTSNQNRDDWEQRPARTLDSQHHGRLDARCAAHIDASNIRQRRSGPHRPIHKRPVKV